MSHRTKTYHRGNYETLCYSNQFEGPLVDFKYYNIASHNSLYEMFCSMSHYMLIRLSFEKIKDLAKEYSLYLIQTSGILCLEKRCIGTPEFFKEPYYYHFLTFRQTDKLDMKSGRPALLFSDGIGKILFKQ
jgi:hypothetical protein